MINKHLWRCGFLFAAITQSGIAAEIEQMPAKTRPEMKRRIEALKSREARIPLPKLTPEEIAAGKNSVNNGRLRSLYLPESWLGHLIMTGRSSPIQRLRRSSQEYTKRGCDSSHPH